MRLLVRSLCEVAFESSLYFTFVNVFAGAKVVSSNVGTIAILDVVFKARFSVIPTLLADISDSVNPFLSPSGKFNTFLVSLAPREETLL